MFGHNKSNEEQTTTGPGSVQAPTMIDDAASEDLVNDANSGTAPTAQSPQVTSPAQTTPTPLTTQLDDQQASDSTPAEDTSLDATNTSEPSNESPTTESQQPAPEPTPTPLAQEEVTPPEPATDAEAPHTSGPVTPPPAPTESNEETPTPTSPDAGVPAVNKDKLATMKQQALDHLEPLADHLEQDPEEEFRTTMMRIQANDNHTLLDKALDAAKKITDDKVRAQAMLDIINEINYFSQDPPANAPVA